MGLEDQLTTAENAIWFLSFAERDREKALVEKMSVEKNFSHPRKFSEISNEELEEYAGIFVPGGHAPMGDLGDDSELGRMLKHFHQKNKPVSTLAPRTSPKDGRTTSTE
jgi:putative intracellular protease/amidase